MSKKQKWLLVLLLAIDLALLLFSLGQTVGPVLNFGHFAMLSPKGLIARQERDLLLAAVLLMLVVVAPVYFLIFFFAFKYRAGKSEAKYSPDLQSGKLSTFILWAIPIAIIFVLSIINWKSTHALDPYKPIASAAKPVTIQVVALRWKWLFIYPEQNIASVNFVEFPAGAPVNFELTSDGLMNSFWIPQLGGQMYAMAGMETHLHLQADEPGEYNGSAAEINGPGFAGMKFVAKSTSTEDFNAWLTTVKTSANALNLEAYNKLAEPSENNPKVLYSSAEKDLYNTIMMKFMAPGSDMQHMDMGTSSPMDMPGMDMK